MENFDKFAEFAPYILIVLLFIWQGNLFVKPEKLEEKHREIIKEVDDKIDKKINEKVSGKFVELNAYKEFQNRVYSELTEVKNTVTEVKEYLMRGGTK